MALFSTDSPERLLRAIRQIDRRIHAHSRALANTTGLTVPQLLVLRAVETLPAGEVTLAAVAARVELSRSTVSAIVERLVRAEMLVRDRGRRDRRKIEISLTDLARGRLAESPKPLQETFLRRLGELDPYDQETLTRAMEKVAELMGADDLDVPATLHLGVQTKT